MNNGKEVALVRCADPACNFQFYRYVDGSASAELLEL